MLTIDGLGLGGAEMVVRDLARSLDHDRFEIVVCCTKGLGNEIDEELVRDGFNVIGLPGQHAEKAEYLSFIKLRRIIRQQGIDIVHTHAAPALFDAAPCRLSIPGLKLVHTFHYGNYPFDSWRHHMLEYVFSRVPDRLVAVGLEQRSRIQQTYKLREHKIDVVWNGVEDTASQADPEFRNSIGTGNRILVGTIAKLIEQKGLDDLLDVARHCRDADLPMQFVVVGDGPLRTSLESRRRELDLGDTVVMTGWIKDAAVNVLPSFDVFFQPSRWEAMSIVILEAMANSKAVVATKVGDNPHVIKHGTSGILVDSGDIKSMTDALVAVQDAAIRERLGSAARSEYVEKFTTTNMIDRYEKLYCTLMVS